MERTTLEMAMAKRYGRFSEGLRRLSWQSFIGGFSKELISSRTFCITEVLLKAYPHQVKAKAKRKKSENHKKISKCKRKTSKKILAFARCGWTLRSDQFYMPPWLSQIQMAEVLGSMLTGITFCCWIFFGLFSRGKHLMLWLPLFLPTLHVCEKLQCKDRVVFPKVTVWPYWTYKHNTEGIFISFTFSCPSHIHIVQSYLYICIIWDNIMCNAAAQSLNTMIPCSLLRLTGFTQQIILILFILTHFWCMHSNFQLLTMTKNTLWY